MHRTESQVWKQNSFSSFSHYNLSFLLSFFSISFSFLYHDIVLFFLFYYSFLQMVLFFFSSSFFFLPSQSLYFPFLLLRVICLYLYLYLYLVLLFMLNTYISVSTSLYMYPCTMWNDNEYGSGESLEEIDYEQLKIENQLFQEKITQRNREFLTFKLTAVSTQQTLNKKKV